MSLVRERETDPNIGVILDREQTLEAEAHWLSNKLAEIALGNQISVVADVGGKLVGNSEVTRGRGGDEFLHGNLGIAVSKKYRDVGIGSKMMRVLVGESRKAGLKTLETRGLCK